MDNAACRELRDEGNGAMPPQKLEQPAPTAYEQDFVAWTLDTARLLRAGRLSEIDTLHVAEELEAMGKSEKRELLSRLTVLLAHLLTWNYQPARRSRRWQNTILTQRIDIQELLTDSPSLRPTLEEKIAVAYEKAVLYAENETGLEQYTFPATCPFAIDELLDRTFLPQEGQ